MIFWNRRAINHLFTMISRGASWAYSFSETKRLRRNGVFKILILLCLLSSCSQDLGDTIEEKDGYEVILIDNCEYIQVKQGFGYSRVYCITHKGNCKNHGK